MRLEELLGHRPERRARLVWDGAGQQPHRLIDNQQIGVLKDDPQLCRLPDQFRRRSRINGNLVAIGNFLFERLDGPSVDRHAIGLHHPLERLALCGWIALDKPIQDRSCHGYNSANMVFNAVPQLRLMS